MNINKIISFVLCIIIILPVISNTVIFAQNSEVKIQATSSINIDDRLKGTLKIPEFSYIKEVTSDINGKFEIEGLAELLTNQNNFSSGEAIKATFSVDKAINSNKGVVYNAAVTQFDITKENYLDIFEVKIAIDTYAIGRVQSKKYGQPDSSAVPMKDTLVQIDGNVVSTDSKGNFSFIEKVKTNEASKTSTIISVTEDYPEHSRIISYSPTKRTEIIIEEYFEPQDNMYEYKNPISDNGYVSQPGIYTINGKNPYLLSTQKIGLYKDEIDLEVNSDGRCENIYVMNAIGDTSKPVKNSIKLDQAPPTIISINDLETSSINMKDFGMFSNSSVGLKFNITANDVGSGVEYLKLVGETKEGDLVEFLPNQNKQSGDNYTLSFTIPMQKGKVLEYTLFAYVEDKVGNKSKFKLLNQNEDTSTLIIEDKVPLISNINTAGKLSQYDWFSTKVNYKLDIIDPDSGLNSVIISINDVIVKSIGYTKKINGKQSFSEVIDKTLIEELINNKGTYKIDVEATDNSGNLKKVTKTVKIDLINPKLELLGIEQGKHYNNTPNLSILNDEKHFAEKGSFINLKVVHDAKTVLDKNYYSRNQIEYNNFSKDGIYKICAYSQDPAGNKSLKKEVHFIVDKTAPKIQIIGAKNNTYYSGSRLIYLSVNERFYETCDIDISVIREEKGNKDSISFPINLNGNVSVSKKNFSKTGTYTIAASAIDKAGNRSKGQVLSFTVDSQKPVIEISGIEEKAYGYDEKIVPVIKIDDSYLSEKKIELKRVSDDKKVTVNFKDKFNKYGGIRAYADFPKEKINDDIYLLDATAVDLSGNRETKTVTFAVNRFGSSFSYDNNIRNINGNHINEIPENFKIREINVTKVKKHSVEIKQDGFDIVNPKTSVKSKEQDSNWSEYEHEIQGNNFKKDGVYSVDVISKDAAGNTSVSSDKKGEIKFTLDKTKPTIVITGVKESSIYNEPKKNVTITVADNFQLKSKSVYINNKLQQVKWDNSGKTNITIPEGINHTIKVLSRDIAGNESITEIDNITISTNAFIRFYANKPLFYGFLISLLVLITSLSIYVAKRRKIADEYDFDDIDDSEFYNEDLTVNDDGQFLDKE